LPVKGILGFQWEQVSLFIYNSGNTQKSTLVLNFYAFSRRKNTCNPPTMTALSAAGDPSRHRYWVPDLSSIPEDEEVWVFQDPPLQLCTISLLSQCGTHRTVAADVEKFPFRHLAIKRILAALRSAPTTMMQPPLPTTPPPEPNTTSPCTLPFLPTATTPTKRTPVDLDAINREIIRSIQFLRRMEEQLQKQSSPTTKMSTPPPEPTTTQEITTTASSHLPLKLTATTTTVCTSDWFLPIPTTTTTTITKPPSQLPLQQVYPPPPYSSKMKEQPQPEPITNTLPSTRKNMELDRPFPTALPPTAPPDYAAPFPTTEPSKSHLPTAPATPLMPLRSRLERLLDNIHSNTIELWMPDAVYRRSVRHLSEAPDLSCAQPTDHANPANRTLYFLANLQYHNNNSLLAEYATSPYNPAFDIHPKRTDLRQKCHQHHSFITNSAVKPYNPAFDLHPMLTDHHQQGHQHHTRLPLALPVQVFAQNKRPP